MASPFPGMDPYLESPVLWPEFQHGLVQALSEHLQPLVDDRYRLRIGRHDYVTEQALFTSIVREEQAESFLEIRQRGSGRLITAVEVISLANRTNGDGRKEYARRRDQHRQNGAHLVEIDLVLQGRSCFELPPGALPACDYAVSIVRASQPGRAQVYTKTIRERLPRIQLPLAAGEADLIVDLQLAFRRCYERSFDGRIDYQRDPPVSLAAADRQWLLQLLHEQHLR